MSITPHNTDSSSFDQIAGSSFGAVGMLSIVRQFRGQVRGAGFDESLVQWLLMSEAIARNDNPQGVSLWFNRQLEQMEVTGSGAKRLVRSIMHNPWLAVVPITLFEDEAAGMNISRDLLAAANASIQEMDAIVWLIMGLLSDHASNLFQSMEWCGKPIPDRYDQPEKLVVVKLGMLMAQKVDDSQTSEQLQDIYNKWREVLRLRVLVNLENLQPIQRGFASGFPQFEDLVISLVQSAYIYQHAGISETRSYIADVCSRENEALCGPQAMLVGALLGHHLGYSKISHWIQDPEQRRVLSRQALGICSRDSSNLPKGISQIEIIVRSTTREGTLSAFLGDAFALNALSLSSDGNATSATTFRASATHESTNFHDYVLQILDAFPVSLKG